MIRKDLKTLRKYCKEYTLIENYKEALDSPDMWECHHRLELDDDGNFLNSRSDLKEKGLYFGRHPEELIFLPRTLHRRMHNRGQSEETKAKLSRPGDTNPMYGMHWSEEYKLHFREASKGKPKQGLRAKSRFCQKYGMTKREMADKLGIPSGSVSRLDKTGRLAELLVKEE